MESFLGHMIAGGVFCLFGGQPLTVLGCTGPVSFHQSFTGSWIPFLFTKKKYSLSSPYFIRRCSSLRRSLSNSATVMVSRELPTRFIFVRFFAHIKMRIPLTGIYYLTMRLWIGLWAAFFCLIIVAVDGSAIVRYFTRLASSHPGQKAILSIC